MPRVRTGVARNKRQNRLRKSVSGYRGGRSKLRRTALDAETKALQYAFRDRRNRKREMRGLWITRIGAALMDTDLSYSRFIGGLKKAGVDMNRKSLSELAIHDPDAFKQLVDTARSANN